MLLHQTAGSALPFFEFQGLLCCLLQDSLIQTVKQVQATFETLLDILQLQTQLQTSVTHRQTAASELQSFLCSTSSTLLAIGKHLPFPHVPTPPPFPSPRVPSLAHTHMLTAQIVHSQQCAQQSVS